jgi:hypothetical protein
MISKLADNGIEIIRLETKQLRVGIVPALGGKVLSIFNRPLKKEFLWTNKNLPLKVNPAGSPYNPNFIGGIDELIPNDKPETIDSIDYGDHGELWTTQLEHYITDEKVTMQGVLPLSGLYYSKTVWLDPQVPVIYLDYLIRNDTSALRHFMWKLHPAINIQAGDRLVTTAKHARVGDASYSRFKTELSEFNWPQIENTDASILPEKNGTMDFFVLYDIPKPEMQLETGSGDVFCFRYDPKVFPYQWYFASYGGLLNHYMALLEPCTNPSWTTNEAIQNNQSAKLQPGESLKTTIQIFAGKKKDLPTQWAR